MEKAYKLEVVWVLIYNPLLNTVSSYFDYYHLSSFILYAS